MLWGNISGHLQLRSWVGSDRTEPGDPPEAGACPGPVVLTHGAIVAGAELEGSFRVRGKDGTELLVGPEVGTEVRFLEDLRVVRVRVFKVLLWVASSCSSTSSRHFMKPRRWLPGPWAPTAAKA